MDGQIVVPRTDIAAHDVILDRYSDSVGRTDDRKRLVVEVSGIEAGVGVELEGRLHHPAQRELILATEGPDADAHG